MELFLKANKFTQKVKIEQSWFIPTVLQSGKIENDMVYAYC